MGGSRGSGTFPPRPTHTLWNTWGRLTLLTLEAKNSDTILDILCPLLVNEWTETDFRSQPS